MRVSHLGLLISIPGILCAFFIFNLIIKSYQIQSIPPGAPFDETHYAVEAQTILKYGTDISGKWHPWFLSPSHGMYSELTSTMLIPGFLLFPNNPILASKFMPVLLGSLLPLLLALIVYYLTANRFMLIATLGIATFNPWIFQFSRMGYDSLFSLVLLNLGLVLILYLSNWKKLFAFLPILLAFFQYQGHKLVFVPLITITVLLVIIKSSSVKLFSYQTYLKKAYLPLYLIVIFSIILTSSYLIRLPHLSSNIRMNEFSLLNQPGIATRVNDNRRLSLDNPFTTIVDNKYTALLPILAKRFLFSFDSTIFFLEGDQVVDTFAVNNYGIFHWLDLVLFLIGLGIIFKHTQRIPTSLFLFSYILIGTLPNVVRNGNPWITFRGAFVFCGLIMLAGIGLGYILEKLTFARQQILVFSLYCLSSGIFFYTYFFRYPLIQTTHEAFYDRVLSSYIKRQPNNDFIIVSSWTSSVYNYILHYNQLINQENKAAIYSSAMGTKKTVNNISLNDQCPEDNSLLSPNTVIAIDWIKATCPIIQNSNHVAIKSLVDNGTKYVIINDTLCNKYVLSPYTHVTKNVFQVESLSDSDFCTAFFTR